MSHPLNRYNNYEHETNQDAYEYSKRCYDEEKAYWQRLDDEIEREYFGNDDR